MRSVSCLVVMIFLVFFTACTKAPLVGKWIKISSELCTLAQPNELEFFDDGTYVGALPNWKGGSYTLVDSNRIKLETTTGLGVYEFKVSGESLEFENGSGCTFRYRRAL